MFHIWGNIILYKNLREYTYNVPFLLVLIKSSAQIASNYVSERI